MLRYWQGCTSYEGCSRWGGSDAWWLAVPGVLDQVREELHLTGQLREPYRIRVIGHWLATTQNIPQGNVETYPSVYTRWILSTWFTSLTFHIVLHTPSYPYHTIPWPVYIVTYYYYYCLNCMCLTVDITCRPTYSLLSTQSFCTLVSIQLLVVIIIIINLICLGLFV